MPSGPATVIRSPGASAASARVPGPTGVDEEAELAGGREAEAERPRQEPTRRLEHEELAGDARLEPAAAEPHEPVRPDGLVGDDPEPLAPHPSPACRDSRAPSRATIPIRSCSESVASARAFAIACTAAAAPEIVVMHGTRATSAASRIR